MPRAMVLRLYQASLWQQPPARHQRRTAAAAAAAAAGAAAAARRGLANSNSISSPATGAPPEGEEKEGEEGEGEIEPTDEAAAKRAALLKRYGDRTPPSGPIAVKATSTRPAGGFDVEKSVSAEANHNEIWGDYVRYMEHQRKKGWKT